MAMALLLTLAMAGLLLHGTSAAAPVNQQQGTSDWEIAERKVQCYEDIDKGITVWCVESGCGLWGYACKSSTIDKENCALICLSSTCYDSVYGNDPLEEGEVDWKRGRDFKACIRGEQKGDRLARAKSVSM